MENTTRLWFVTDIHGSDLCFTKLLNAVKSRKRPNVLVIGGDIVGKIVVPIVRNGNSTWKAWVPLTNGRLRSIFLGSLAEVTEFEKTLANQGEYGFRCTPEEADAFQKSPEYCDEVVERLHCDRLRRWMELAESKLRGTSCRLFCNAGNDDKLYIDKILDESPVVIRPEGRVLEIDENLTMISTGYTNPTPWHCPRDIPEKALSAKIEAMAVRIPDMSRCIFNFHAPPYGTALDKAKELVDLVPQMSVFGPEEISIGSTAVRQAIEKYQPCVGLHGHIHEIHAFQRIGRTVCFNPGSEYKYGRLAGVYLEFQRAQLTAYGLTREAG